MKRSRSFSAGLTALFCLVLATTVFAQKTRVQESYQDIEKVQINIGAGDITVQNSRSNTVEVDGEYDEESIDLKIETRGGKLTIEEKSKGKNNGEKSSWTLKIPDGAGLSINVGAGEVIIENTSGEIEANIGAGDFRLKNISGKIQLNTGTGDINLEDSNGEFNFNTGTGKVMMRTSQGIFSANSGTGNVQGEGLSITGDSGLNSGTGNVSLSLGSPPKSDVSVNSGTGDSVLDFNGQSFDGKLTMRCDEEKGKIAAPFSFDEEEIEEQGRNKTLKKTKDFGNSGVKVSISSGTGTARVAQ